MHIVVYSLSFFELKSCSFCCCCCIMLIICCISIICCCWCCCWLSAWIWICFCRSSICSFLSFCWNSLSLLCSSSWSSLNFKSRSAFFSSRCRVSPPDLRFFSSLYHVLGLTRLWSFRGLTHCFHSSLSYQFQLPISQFLFCTDFF